MIPESALDIPVLAEHMGAILSNPQAAVKMSAAALSAGIPDATERLAALVEQLAEEG